MRDGLERFTELSRLLSSGEHIYPGSATEIAATNVALRDDSAFRLLALPGRTPEQLLRIAKAAAMTGDHERARLILRKLLRDLPNYHDARAQLGRSYAWERRFGEARVILLDLQRRAPSYVDGYIALVNVEIWAGRGADAVERVNGALARFPGNAELLAARALAIDLASLNARR